MRKLLITIAILSALGAGVSAYALWQHYAPLGSAFCNLGETFSCDIVNQSAYAEVVGIPVAGIGVAGYLLIGALALAAVADDRRAAVLPWLVAAAVGGLGVSLVLTYIEFFVIGAVCILCVASQAFILGITGSSGYAHVRNMRTLAQHVTGAVRPL